MDKILSTRKEGASWKVSSGNLNQTDNWKEYECTDCAGNDGKDGQFFAIKSRRINNVTNAPQPMVPWESV